jgi:uncharacterized protein
MIPEFIGRERELEFLERAHAKKGFKLIVLYGRRRVGKTELLKKFLDGKEGAYILFTDESLDENLKELKEKFATLTGKELFRELDTHSLYDLFKYFASEASDRKLAIAIDEFPYLLGLNKGLLSTFQKIADELLAKSNITLILCGSSLSVMENDVLGYKSPLYGRHTLQWKLQPFDFATVLKILPDTEEAMKAQFVFGNIPYYLGFYDPGLDLRQNIKTGLLTKGSGLYDEPLVLLRQEFRESRTYRLILKYISLGYKSTGKICSATGIDKSNLMKYLSTLEETGIIRHILPLGMKRKGIYEINDPLFRFWFRFVYPNRDRLEIGNIASVEAQIKSEINQFFGTSFEYLIEELLNARIFTGLVEYNDVRKWWHREHEIDIVALNEPKKSILFCECKWKDKVDAQAILSELKEKAKLVDWNKEKRKESYALFAKSFKKRTKGVMCFDLKDLERALKR